MIPKYVALLYPPGEQRCDRIIIKESEYQSILTTHSLNQLKLSKLNYIFRPLDKLKDKFDNFCYSFGSSTRFRRGYNQSNSTVLFLCQLCTESVRTLTHTINYPIPQYYPTNPMTLQHLHVWLQDEHEQPIRFAWGSVHMLLHFRRRRCQTVWDPQSL